MDFVSALDFESASDSERALDFERFGGQLAGVGGGGWIQLQEGQHKALSSLLFFLHVLGYPPTDMLSSTICTVKYMHGQ